MGNIDPEKGNKTNILQAWRNYRYYVGCLFFWISLDVNLAWYILSIFNTH